MNKKENIPYKTQFTLEHRLEESNRIREKYPNRIPVIVEMKEQSVDVPDIDKKKFLVPNDLTVSQFIFVVRKRIQLPAEKALFFFIDDTIPSTNNLMSKLYTDHKDEDGFLYINYTGENTFGQ
jgi:GABA(A) receptor-associated protein